MDALVSAPARRKPMTFAVAILAIAVGTIAAVFAFQATGYPPCDLCLKERMPYYAAMVLAAVAAAWRGSRVVTMILFAGLAVIFLASACFGFYHAGVEWGLWAGPADCTGALGKAASNTDFLQQLRTVKVIRCDAAAVHVLGLSLAGWNVLVSLAAAGAALVGLDTVHSDRSRGLAR